MDVKLAVESDPGADVYVTPHIGWDSNNGQQAVWVTEEIGNADVEVTARIYRRRP